MNAESLRSISLFAGVPGRQLEQIARWADEVEVSAGRRLLDQGRYAYEFFVIADGTVEVRRDEQPIATLGAGDCFGEIALLEGIQRTATIETLTPVRAIVMDARGFAAMMNTSPTVAERIRAIEQRRLANE